MNLRKITASIVATTLVVTALAGVAAADSDESELPEYYPDEPLEADELNRKPLRELSLMRNSIYARAGHEFSTDWLREYFEDQDWYDGGGLDSDALSDIDRDNVQTLLDVEAGLHERELRNRRERIWDDHDGVPSDGQWSFPGPFDESEEAIEARLIDEAIDELLEKTDSYRRPWDPGEAELDGDSGLPSGLGDAHIGEPLGDLDREELADEYRSVELVDGNAKLLPVLDSDGRVEQIIGHSHQVTVPTPGLIPPLVDEGRDNPEKRLTVFTKWATAVAESAGPPDEARSPDDPTLVWSHDDKTLQLDYVPTGKLGVPDVAYVRAWLAPDDPNRICGLEDGFESWYEEFVDVVNSEDGKEIAEYFDFPFPDRSVGIGGWYPEPSREFETREEFLARESYDDLAPVDDAEPTCTTRVRGYGVSIPNKGGLKFERVDGDWKAVRIDQTTHW